MRRAMTMAAGLAIVGGARRGSRWRSAWRSRRRAPIGTSVERGTLRLHYVQKPIGYERLQRSRATATRFELTSDFDFTDRGGRVQLAATLRTKRRFHADALQREGQELSLRQRRLGRSRSTAATRSFSADGADSRVTLPQHVLHRGRLRAVRGADAAAALLEAARPAARDADRARRCRPNDVIIEARGREAIRVGANVVRAGSLRRSTASSGDARRCGSTSTARSPRRSRAPAA